ncbi:MAG: exodeoxyribonuclease III [Deltaproteobacteria bacterium]|nr:exodeoxyribonuclease III [Deltaproteobacteria bacterium]
MSMKIGTFNVNGIRARLPIVMSWLETQEPDVLCLQETKVADTLFPHEALESRGYCCVYRGQKAYNGVAVLSKQEPDDVSFGFLDGYETEEARLAAIRLGDLWVVNTYVPQGQAPDSEKFLYKLDWLGRLCRYFKRFYRPEGRLCWVGDFNVAPEPIDVYDPERLLGHVGYHPDEHCALEKIKAWGFVDVIRKLRPEERIYSFWDYRIPQAVSRAMGWRIDHIWATVSMAERCVEAWVDLEPRVATRPSDHAVVAAVFEI